MRAFQISQQQISAVIGAAIADELSRRFNRHFDFLTTASWGPETSLGVGGLALSQEELVACAIRVANFFGAGETQLPDDNPSIDDWAGTLRPVVSSRLSEFSFKSAARNVDQATCHHNADRIYQDSAAAANLLLGRRRLLSLVAPHSLLGFELSVLTPGLLHIEAADCRRMSPDKLSVFARFGDVLVATPTLWRYMVQENLAAPDNSIAVSFGEPMTPDLAADMRKSGFGVLRELYGSTESGLIGWRDDPSEPFLLFEHWRGADDALIRLLPNGEEEIVSAMDQLDWIDDRRFRLLGRRDGAVQVGAVNVFPEEVATMLRAHPKIKRCGISVGRRADGASRLIANIVLEGNMEPDDNTVREIDAFCRQNLRQQERPRIYNFEREV